MKRQYNFNMKKLEARRNTMKKEKDLKNIKKKKVKEIEDEVIKNKEKKETLRM